MRIGAKKLALRKNESFVDSLISGIWAIFIAIVSFIALYVYVGVTTYERSLAQEKLFALDQLLALRRLTATPDFLSTRTAQMKDLPHFFSSALSESINEPVDEDNSKDGTRKSVSKFGKVDVPSTEVVLDVPMRMAVNGTCDALVTQLSPGKTFHFITILVVGEIYAVKSEQTKLVNFHGCHPGPNSNFYALIFALENGQNAFAIPQSLDETFLGTRKERIFTNYPLRNIDQIRDLLPTPFKEYFNIGDEKFVVLHGKAIEYLILKFANNKLEKWLTPDRLDDAIHQIYEEKEKDASYFGINASSKQFIRIGPLIYFLLSFDLWRRVRRLPDGRFTSGKYWFAFETNDLIGRAYAFLCALAPIIFGITVYTVFAISQGLGLVLFDRVITPSGLLTLTFPEALAPGWYSGDPLAVMILLFVPIQLLIVCLTSLKLTRVVASNLRPRHA